MFVPLLVLVVLMCGMALDAGMLYNRHIELSGLARAAAMAAAQQLNGKSDGITAAKTAAKEAAERFKYKYGLSITWNEDAIKFGTTPERSGSWQSASSVADASTVHYVKVDTAGLGAQFGQLTTLFIGTFSSELSTVVADGIVIAGRTGLDVVPIAICAMSDSPATERHNPGLGDSELVEYGFRRGVSYDLMQLNPKGTQPARYLLNPLAAPGTTSTSFSSSIIPPFACVGTTWIPRLFGGSVHVSSLPDTSPLNAVFASLNSRFDTFTGNQCHHSSAPPDSNIKAYPYDKNNGAPWMVPAIGTVAATSTTERGWLETVADIPAPGTTLTTVTAASYGPLWAYAKAAKYAAYVEGTPEPHTGYATFAPGDWGKLYKSGLSANGYPSVYPYSTPYAPIGSTNPGTVATGATARKEFWTPGRRLLHIPLLSCSAGAPSGSNVTATVAGVGRFFMTVPATRDSLIGEFAGAAPESSISGPVEIFP
jgi:hypothetical protein